MEKRYSLDLNVTSDCNWRCRYCIEKHHHCANYMSEEVADKIIEKIDYILDNNYYDGIRLSFWGGEPTLNYTIIEKFINYYYDNIKVSFEIFTNGSLLRNYYPLIDKVINYFQNPSRFEIQISYDGFAIQERKRRTINNLPTADDTKKLIEEVYGKRYSFHLKSTFSYDDVDYIYESYKDIVDLYKTLNNYQGISYTPTLDYSKDFIQFLSNGEYEKFKNDLLFQLEKISVDEYKRIGDFTDNNSIFTWLSEDNMNKYCAAGLDYHTVSYDGNMYTCHGCLYIDNHKEHIFASIDDSNEDFIYKIKEYNKLFENMDANINEECKNCNSAICYKCNSECYSNSSEKTFLGKWYDFKNNRKELCLLYKEISYLIIAYKELLMKKMKLVLI